MKPELTILPDGTKYWYLNGKLHREDGPAIEYPDGTKKWYLNSKRHREDGPAIEYADGDKHWYLNDKLLIFAEWLELAPISNEEKMMIALAN